MHITRIALLGMVLWTASVYIDLNAQERARDDTGKNEGSTTPAFISPDLNGSGDRLILPLSITDQRAIASYSLFIRNEAGALVRTIRNKDTRPETANLGNLWDRFIRVKEGLKLPRVISWDGRTDDGSVVPNGVYSYQVEASDDNGNSSQTDPRPVIVDTAIPTLSSRADQTAFAPNGDRTELNFEIGGGGSLAPIDFWTGTIRDAKDVAVRRWIWNTQLPERVVWDGRTDSGLLADDGVYTFRLFVRDKAGNRNSIDIPNLLLINQATPVALTIDNAAFSPNGDGIKDAVRVSVNSNDRIKVDTWTATVFNDKGELARSYQGRDTSPREILFDGNDAAGKVLPEGAYSLELEILYVNGNRPRSRSASFVLDITKPQGLVTLDDQIFSPNGDGLKDQATLRQSGSSELVWKGQISRSNSRSTDPVRSWIWRDQLVGALVWDGRDDRNSTVPDGEYTYQIFSTDSAGNVAWSIPVYLRVDNRPSLISIRSLREAFSPGSTVAGASVADFTLKQSNSDGVVSWRVRIRAANGTEFLYDASGSEKPPASVTWDGKTSAGALVADGVYLAEYQVTYEKGDRPFAVSNSTVVDTVPPKASLHVENPFFSPDGDGKQDTTIFAQDTSEEEIWKGTIFDLSNRVVKSLIWQKKADNFVWNGTDNTGNKVPDGDYRYELRSRDGAGNEGSVHFDQIRVSTVPPELGLSTLSSAFSPNGDGVKDSADFFPKVASPPDCKSWTLQINPLSGGKARTTSGTGAPPPKLIWDGRTDGGRIAPQGAYQAVLTVEFKAGQSQVAKSPKVTLDLTSPTASISASTTTFSPNGDGYKDTTTIVQEVNKEELWKGEIRATTSSIVLSGLVVRSFEWQGRPPKTLMWDGIGDTGELLPDGIYTYQLQATDGAGNNGFSSTIEITIDNRPSPVSLRLDQRWFSPGTASAISKLAFFPVLTLNEGVESWRLEIRSSKGEMVRLLKGVSNPPSAIEWDGKTDSANLAPDGEFGGMLTVVYLKGDRPQFSVGPFGIRTRAPGVAVTCADSLFSPDGDGFKDTLAIQQTSSNELEWEGAFFDPSGARVRTYYWKGSAPGFSWDGKDDRGNVQPDGEYRYQVRSTDQAGNTTAQEIKGIVVDSRPTGVLLTTESTGFAPSTGRAGFGTISFKPLLKVSTGIVAWTLSMFSSDSKVTERSFSGTGSPPTAFVWDGTRSNKTIAPDGRYEARLVVEYQKGNRPEARSAGFVLNTRGPTAQISLPSVPFSPDDDGENDELSIGIIVSDLSPVRDWIIEILDPKGQRFAVFSGQGRPAPQLLWNGRSDTGERVQSGMDYTLVLKATDILGNSSTGKAALSVDVLVLRDGDKLRIQTAGIIFAPGSSDPMDSALDSAAKAQNEKILRGLAAVFRVYGSYRVQIEAHAIGADFAETRLSEDEKKAELQSLSEKRALSVRKSLITRGIPEDRLKAVGIGSSRPLFPQDDTQNAWKNRRIEFILSK